MHILHPPPPPSFVKRKSSYLPFTNFIFQGFNDQSKECDGVSPIHFTDLLRGLMLPSPLHCEMTERIRDIACSIYNASHLFDYALHFEVSQSACLLDIKFHKGVPMLPCLIIDDSMEIYLIKRHHI